MTKAVASRIITRCGRQKVEAARAMKVQAKQQLTSTQKKVAATTLEVLVQTTKKEKLLPGRLPRNFITKLVEEYKHLIPNLDAKMIKNAYNYRAKVKTNNEYDLVGISITSDNTQQTEVSDMTNQTSLFTESSSDSSLVETRLSQLSSHSESSSDYSSAANQEAQASLHTALNVPTH